MKQNVTFDMFTDAFSDERKDTFTYEGKKALFDYLLDYEDGTGEEVELDIIALCCEYTEYDDLKDLQSQYSDIDNLEDLEDYTQLIKIFNNDGTESDRFIIQNY